jgi:uncharacterized membrane protein
VQIVLVLMIILTLLAGAIFIGFGSPPSLVVIVGLQVVALIAVAWRIRRENQPRVIGQYALIALGFYLLMFGLCFGVG